MKDLPPDPRQQRLGVFYGLGAYLAWGVLPLYFKAVETVPSLEVLAHRVVWSLVFLVLIVQIRGQWSGFKPLFKSARIQITLMVTTVLIAINWGVFIWAIVNGRLVEASIPDRGCKPVLRRRMNSSVALCGSMPKCIGIPKHFSTV